MKTKQHSWRKKEKRNARSGVAHTPLPPAPPTSSSPLFVVSTHTLTISLMHTHTLHLTHARTLFLQFNVSRYHILFFVVQQQQQRQRPSLCLASVERKKERPFCYKINRSTLTRIFIGRSQTEVRQFVFPNWFFCQFAQILCNEIFTSLNCVAGLLSSSLLLFPARKILILERI